MENYSIDYVKSNIIDIKTSHKSFANYAIVPGQRFLLVYYHHMGIYYMKTACTDRRCYAQWQSLLVWTCTKKRSEQGHPQSDGQYRVADDEPVFCPGQGAI